MEYNQAQKLKQEWGDRPCDHPRFERVYYVGAFLVGYVCTNCGADVTVSQKLEIEEARRSGTPV